MGRAQIVDVGVVALAGLLTSVNMATQIPAFRAPYDAIVGGLLLTGALSLWFRRRAPVAVAWFIAGLAAMLVAAVWIWPGAEPGTQAEADSTLLPAAAPFAAYSVEVFGRGRRSDLLPLAVVGVVACLGVPPAARVSIVIGPVLTLVGGPAVLGRYLRARAERREREHRLSAERARIRERQRLAAEVHDIVSHRVSVMVLQAGALHLTTADESARRAAGELRATGCQALAELRDLVGLLSADGPSQTSAHAGREPLPDLSVLVEASESVGIPVETRTVGDPALVSPAVGRTVYRVVQEALTNVTKHAPGSRVRLEVRYLPAGVEVSIHNTAPTGTGDAALTSAGGGAGLLGLRRRIELINGTLRAGPCPDGGFRVDAGLPSFVRATGEGR
ncbi:histidine kinase [Streptomyces sp. MP131-18]|uniref:sensor histidine kinase n=1 Tax=Streptomyces sp. MP131-18 TaxID=1857892 RepID=UPI00097BD29C|nr:histidine kinase [Streptomyces sp. MP131-18]ONK09767.1 Sensor histidine kinase DesK [Streptomyces sp. MP131-18]